MNFSNVYGRIQAWRNYRETVDQLSRLSRHELDDLGIAPGDINRIARKSSGLV